MSTKLNDKERFEFSASIANLLNNFASLRGVPTDPLRQKQELFDFGRK